jgi:hypothetical protein
MAIIASFRDAVLRIRSSYCPLGYQIAGEAKSFDPVPGHLLDNLSKLARLDQVRRPVSNVAAQPIVDCPNGSGACSERKSESES